MTERVSMLHFYFSCNYSRLILTASTEVNTDVLRSMTHTLKTMEESL
jgi:hypothetical protein